LIEAPSDWVWLPERAPHGARVPIQQQAAAWVSNMQAQLSGTLLAFDYCTALTSELAAIPWRDWLRTYSGHERGEHYLRNTGHQDITTQVCLDQLPAPSAMRTQAQFLARWGIDDLVAEGRAQWAAEAASPSLSSLRMRSRITESESLLEPHGLGGFFALEWTV
jgi:SAM-dependent MidA family methyltransferase